MKKTSMLLRCILFLAVVSCSKDEIAEIGSHETSPKGGDQIVLGNHIEDPYKFENIEKSVIALQEEGVALPFSTLSPTDKYVRVVVSSENEQIEIEKDTNIVWFDFPLDYELSEGGCYYHDSKYADSVVCKYGVVPIDYTFTNGIEYEILYDVFIPEHHPQYKQKQQYFDLLEDASSKVCGLVDEIDATKSNASEKWTPSASIKAYDDIAGQCIPMQGVKVTIKRGTKTHYAITDANGNCTFPSQYKKNQKVTYAVKWERSYWDIRDGLWNQAYYSGPKIKGKWNLQIQHGERNEMFAAIHRVALKCYYGNILGVMRPILNVGKTKLSYINGDGPALGMTFGFWNFAGTIPNIRIWGYNNGIRRDPSIVISTTFHEFGHMVHRKVVGTNAFLNTNRFVCESWARVFQYCISNHYYNSDLVMYPNCATYDCPVDAQNWVHTDTLDGKPYPYTPVFIDLVDDFNQGLSNSLAPYDVISGYTLLEIQNYLLPNSYGLTSLRTNMKQNKLHNATDGQIDSLLFQYYGLGF